jgi:hypothetical protein
MKPKIKKEGNTYNITGKSGNPAGHIYRVGMARRVAWLLEMLSTPTEVYFSFSAAKREALTKAERY